MPAFENTVTIQRPAEDVFAFLADFENIPKWNYAIEQTSKISAGPAGVGTRYRQTRTIPSRGVEDFEITAFRRPGTWPSADRSARSRQRSAMSLNREPARLRSSTP